jgi:clan AA aspartic protease (TIGR02281 family)
MICPKCGFSQPDDIYCALCGVSIEKYLWKRRKRRYKAYLLIALTGIVALSITKYITSVDHIEAPEPAGKYGYKESKTQTEEVTSPGRRPYRPLSGNRVHPQRKTDRPPQTRLQVESFKPEGRQGKRLIGGESKGETYTAREWFEKGRALDDESEAEIECYKKAIELDPEFAPAHYCLGAIYCRRANYELADQEFAKFLKHASETDRQAYDIYVYCSPSDVERLSEEKIKGETPAEEVEKERGEPAGEETGQQTGDEVMTIVRFLRVDGHILVPVIINGFIEAKVLVDTGATITILSRELAQRLRLEEGYDSITLKTMGMDIHAQSARLDSIQLGDLSRSDFPVAVADLSLEKKGEFDGVLGMDFMSHYKMHIDNENNRILLGAGKKGLSNSFTEPGPSYR